MRFENGKWKFRVFWIDSIAAGLGGVLKEASSSDGNWKGKILIRREPIWHEIPYFLSQKSKHTAFSRSTQRAQFIPKQKITQD